MYDFGSTRADDGNSSTESLAKPHVVLTASEFARVSIEYPSSWLLDAVTPPRSVGGGRPVLVIPAFYAGDGLTRRLRAHLRKRDFQVHGWRLGRNHGLTDEVLDGLLARFDALYERHGVPVSVVGWSFGGLLARWLAHERPAQVRQVVCMGSPWRAEGERTRSTSLFERAAIKHGLSDRAEQVLESLRRPLPVPCTAIFSKTDGILNWRSCALDDDDRCENIPVPSSHVGLVSNPLALAVLADRLSQDPDNPQAFNWSRCLRRSLVGAYGTAASTTAPVSV